MNRQEALEAALKAVSDHEAVYGVPAQNFHRIARRWSVHILNRYGVSLNLSPDDVAVMCIDLKLSRIEETPDHPDSWVDAAGYAACGAEITSGAPAEWGEPGALYEMLPGETPADAMKRHRDQWLNENPDLAAKFVRAKSETFDAPFPAAGL